jgi:hypothetical protein
VKCPREADCVLCTEGQQVVCDLCCDCLERICGTYTLTGKLNCRVSRLFACSIHFAVLLLSCKTQAGRGGGAGEGAGKLFFNDETRDVCKFLFITLTFFARLLKVNSIPAAKIRKQSNFHLSLFFSRPHALSPLKV